MDAPSVVRLQEVGETCFPPNEIHLAHPLLWSNRMYLKSPRCIVSKQKVPLFLCVRVC